jgi:hypothetical protein
MMNEYLDPVTIEAKLMKRDRVGYVQPKSGMFPALEAFHELVVTPCRMKCWRMFRL